MTKDLPNLTVNTLGKQVITVCLFCNKNEILVRDWNKRCPECREKQSVKDAIEKEQIGMGIGKRLPAARIVTDDGKEVWVDKFGREVENPGYDLKNDPRGWGKTGTQPKKREIIT